MKTNLIITVACIIALNVCAQNAPMTKVANTTTEKQVNKGERIKRKSEMYKTTLGLDEAQSNKVELAIKNRNEALKVVKSKLGENKEGFKAEAKPIRKQFRAEMKSILTADQFAKFKDMKKSKKPANKTTKSSVDDDMIDESEPNFDKI